MTDNASMRAVLCDGAGGPEVLRIGQVPRPTPGPGQLLVRVRACGVNRADLLQCRGLYPPPPGEPDILGLELAGEVVACGSGVTGWQPGDRVFGLVGGGAYAEFALLHADLAMPIPNAWSWVEAAAVTEVFFTAGETLFTLGQLQPGGRVLIHAGGSGVGTAAVQMASSVGAQAFVTAGSAEKIARCQSLGATGGHNYHEGDFLPALQAWSNNQGVDVILDFIGAGNLGPNLRSLAVGGRLIVIALMGGRGDNLDMALLLRRRLQIKGFALRGQSIAEKGAITRRFLDGWLPRLVAGEISPVIDSVWPVEQVRQAHEHMAANRNVGKLVLTFTE